MSEVYIMNNFRHLKNVLNYSIKKMAECPAIFCENPDKDFTRDRLLTFETTMRNVICMGIGSLKDELLKLYSHSLETPTTSAFVQARDKIRVEAFKVLFEPFNDRTRKDKINYPGAEPTNVHWTFATGYFKTFVITTLIVFVHRNLVYLDFSHTLLLPAHLRCAPRLTQKKRHSKSFLPKAVSSLQDAQQICVLLLYF